MAFTTVQTGQTIEAAHIKELQGALDGSSGYGQAAALTQLNSSSSYALDVRNLDSSNGYVARFKDEADNVILTLTRTVATFGKKIVATLGSFTAAADMLSMTATWNAGAGTFNAIKAVITNTASAAASCIINLQTATATVFAVTIGGLAFLNDDANAKMTQGLTINQGASDNEILAFKSSDVDHGMTAATETDTYGKFSKRVAASGGMSVTGYTGATQGLYLGGVGVTDDTTKSTAGVGYVYVEAGKKNGTDGAAAGTDANLMVLANWSTTRYIWDAEGSAHADVEWTTYDKYNDLALIGEVETELRANENEAKTERRRALEAAGIVGEGSWHFENGKPRAMVNMSKLAMLHHGALLQVGQRMAELEQRNEVLLAELTAVKGLLAKGDKHGTTNPV